VFVRGGRPWGMENGKWKVENTKPRYTCVTVVKHVAREPCRTRATWCATVLKHGIRECRC